MGRMTPTHMPHMIMLNTNKCLKKVKCQWLFNAFFTSNSPLELQILNCVHSAFAQVLLVAQGEDGGQPGEVMRGIHLNLGQTCMCSMILTLTKYDKQVDQVKYPASKTKPSSSSSILQINYIN